MSEENASLIKKLQYTLRDSRKALGKFKQEVRKLREEREKESSPSLHMLAKNQSSSANTNDKATKVDISISSVLKASIAISLVVLSLYILYLLSDILVLILFSFFFATILHPLVARLESWKIPRGLSILLSYLLLLIVVSIFIITLVPMLKTQGDKLVSSISSYLTSIARDGITQLSIPFVPTETEQWLAHFLNSLRENINFDLLLEELRKWLLANQTSLGDNLEKVATNFLGFVNVVANGLGNAMIILLLTFFILMEAEDIHAFFISLLPKKHRNYFSTKLQTVQTKIGAWVRGQLLLGLAVGTATFLGLLFLRLFGINIEEVFILSVIAGITELIPVIGPIIAAFFAILVAASQGAIPMLAVLILFIVIQQLENNILVPVIMRHAVGLSSLIIIIGMLVGANFLGFLGLILAVPITTIIVLFLDDFLHIERKLVEEEKALEK